MLLRRSAASTTAAALRSSSMLRWSRRRAFASATPSGGSGDGDDAALVLFSGGQDSTTCLGWALDRFQRVETLAFDYGQRHVVELECRQKVLGAVKDGFAEWAPKMGQDHLLHVPVLGEISECSLTRDADIRMTAEGLPNSFVPGRNLLFLTLAATIAFRRNIRHIVGGMCETDFSGYPDCRDDSVKAAQVALNLAMDRRFVLHTPLMWIDKAQTWQMAQDLGGPAFVEVVAEHSHTCYLGDREQRWPWGYGCNACPACELRRKGFEAWSAASAVAPQPPQQQQQPPPPPCAP